jgi:cell division protein FtsB
MTREEQGFRIRLNATVATLVLTLLGMTASTLWSAAKLTAAVESAQQTTDKLERTLDKVGEGVQSLDKRVTVLEDRGNRTQTPPQRLGGVLPIE